MQIINTSRQEESRIRLFSNNYLCFIVFFALACVLKWFYLAERNYYIILGPSLIPGYAVAENYGIAEILKKLLFEYNCILFPTVRPFLTDFLYTLAFKLGGFRPSSLFLLGILLGSLLVPLYYFIITRLFNQEVALFSSLILVFLTNYIQQGLALSTILTGIIFLALTLVFAINHYKKPSLWKLFLSGFFLSLSVFSRYENALFIPFFIFYNLLFDKKTRISLKAIYWLICLSSSIYICVGSFRIYGNSFYFIYDQSRVLAYGGPIGFFKTVLAIKNALNKLLVWPIWALGLGGVCLTLLKYKKRALVIISAFFVFLIFLFYKIERGSIWQERNYFLLLSFFILPLALEFLKAVSSAVFKKSVYAYIILGLAAGLLVFRFHHDNLIIDDGRRLGYPQELIEMTQDLKNIVGNSLLYIQNDDKARLFSPGQIFSLLFYLGRDPGEYSCDALSDLYNKNSFKTNTQTQPLYLLVEKDKAPGITQDKKILIKEYHEFGLYKIIRSGSNN